MIQVNVEKGTRAGWRRVKEPRKPWFCSKHHENKSFHALCWTCHEPRPK